MKSGARGLPRRALLSGLLALACTAGGICPAAELAFDLRLERGRVPDSMRRIRVKEGDVVRLRWTTDQPVIVHLHGYDIEQRLVPGRVTELAFTAYATGRFPVHIHAQEERGAGGTHEEAPLVVIEVYPR